MSIDTISDEYKDTPLTLKQELFCQIYVNNYEKFGNATLAYADAYGYNLDKMSREPLMSSEEDPKLRRKLDDSEYDKAYNVCGVCGSKMLRLPKIKRRIAQLFKEKADDYNVDAELAKVIIQDMELAPKVQAIKHYNELKQRVIKKLDVTTNGKSIGIAEKSDDELAAIIARARELEARSIEGGSGTSEEGTS